LIVAPYIFFNGELLEEDKGAKGMKEDVGRKHERNYSSLNFNAHFPLVNK
jgi:hypothetical protein